MATLLEIRRAMATQLETIPGLQASARILTNPTRPVAFVVPGVIVPHRTMGNGHSDWNVVIELQTSAVSEISGQDNLDAFLAESGDQSVMAAIEANPTLGGLADDLIVQEIGSDYGRYLLADGADIFGARVKVLVLAAGD
jgi:hypothetical protein